MFILSALFLLFTFNLMSVITQCGANCFKDIRFWLTVCSLALLTFVGIEGLLDMK